MGDAIVKCDCCGTHGRRRPDRPCPDFWFYLESLDRTQGTRRGHVYIVWACSAACRDAIWKRGPGPSSIDEAGTQRDREKATKAVADGT